MGSTTLINLSNLIALRRHLDIAANNVANVQTAGFRAQQPTFQEYLKHERKPEIGIASSRPKSLVDAAMAFTSTATGPMRPTGNPLDLAINGNAYFAVQTPEGERYTRDGSFTLDSNGRIVTLDSKPVTSNGGAITVPVKSGPVSIDTQGRVTTIVLGQPLELGQLRLATFPAGTRLEASGGNLLRSNQVATPVQPAAATVQQGVIEGSNVQPPLEMSRLAEINRSYEFTAKMMKEISGVDDLNKLAGANDQ